MQHCCNPTPARCTPPPPQICVIPAACCWTPELLCKASGVLHPPPFPPLEEVAQMVCALVCHTKGRGFGTPLLVIMGLILAQLAQKNPRKPLSTTDAAYGVWMCDVAVLPVLLRDECPRMLLGDTHTWHSGITLRSPTGAGGKGACLQHDCNPTPPRCTPPLPMLCRPSCPLLGH